MTRRLRVIFRLLIGIGLLVLIFLCVSAYLYWASPEFYLPPLTPAQNAAAAEIAEQKVISVRNWAEHAHAIESAHLRGVATQPIGSLHITVTDTQINAFFQKWKALVDWDEKVGPYVSDLNLAIIKGHIVISGNVQSLHTIASLIISLQLDAQGNLQGRLERVLTGRLTLPPPLWESQRSRAIQVLNDLISDWRTDAKMDATGSTNLPGVAVAMGKLLNAALEDKTAPPIIFVPIDQHGGIPARITSLEVGNRQITLTLDAMKSADRRSYWRQEVAH
ncbi:MAG TPA: hypothetical protein VGG19_20065 [Tepidisphaeraceae bacterium]|jgi:hypothetical protein